MLLKQNSTDLYLHNRIFLLTVHKAGSLGLQMVTLYYVLKYSPMPFIISVIIREFTELEFHL